MNRYPDGHNLGPSFIYESPEERQIDILEKKIKEWENMFKDGLKHLDNGIVWDISPNSPIHTFLKQKLRSKI